MPKTHYQYSGKVKPVPFLIATILATAACVGPAIWYSDAGDPSEFSGGTIMCMVVFIIWMFGAFAVFKRYNHSRNVTANVLTGVAICGATWYYSSAGWEGLALFLPLTVLFMMNYYCEKCGKYHDKKTSYILGEANFYKLSKPQTDYSFLPDMSFYDEPLHDMDPFPELIKVEYFYCNSCESKPVVDITSCKWDLHKHRSKHGSHYHTTHKHWRIVVNSIIVQGVYLDVETGRKLSLLLGC